MFPELMAQSDILFLVPERLKQKNLKHFSMIYSNLDDLTNIHSY